MTEEPKQALTEEAGRVALEVDKRCDWSRICASEIDYSLGHRSGFVSGVKHTESVLKPEWERDAVRRAFEWVLEQASLQAEGFPEKPFGGHLTEAMDAVLAEMMEAKG